MKKKNWCSRLEIILQYNYCIAGSWAGWGAQAWALGAGRAGRWGRRARGRWVSGRRALGRVTPRRAVGGRTRGARGMSGRRASGDTAMLACDTATAAATRRQCAQCARPCTAWAWPGAGPVGGSCSQFGFLPGFLTRECF